MFEIAGGILLAVLVLTCLPWIALAAAAVFAVLIALAIVAAIVALWMNLAPVEAVVAFIIVASVGFLYFLGEDEEQWQKFWRRACVQK